MHSKYPGTCVGCGRAFPQGAEIVWQAAPQVTGQRHRGKAWHKTCAPGFADDTSDAEVPEVDNGLPDVIEEPTPTDWSDVTADAPTPMAPDTATSMAPVGDDNMLDLMARSLLPYLKRHGIERGATATPETSREHIICVRPDGTSTRIPDAHPQFAMLLTVTEANRNVYAYGAPGAGKSHATREVATALGLPYYYISLSPMSMPSCLMGHVAPDGKYVRTAFREAYENGGVFAIDEVDNASSVLLATLNSALANKLGAFPDGMIPMHASFYCIATGNTPGFGPTLAFPERRALCRAFRDRFSFLEWGYSKRHETTIARSMWQEAPAASDAWAKWIHSVRAYCMTDYPALTCSPRSIYAGVGLLARGIAPAMVADMTLFQGIDKSVAAKIVAACPLPVIKVGDK